MKNLHARTNRLTDDQQKEWWAANADLLKRDRPNEKDGQRPLWGASEISGLSYMEGEKIKDPKNIHGYALDEWYAGNWSHREAAGQTEGYQPQGLIQTNPKDKREESAWAERDQHAYAIAAKKMMGTYKTPAAQPTPIQAIQRGGEWMIWGLKPEAPITWTEWNGLPIAMPNKGMQSDYPTWTDTCGDLAMTIPSWMGQPSPLNWREEKESNRCLAMTRRTYSDTTWTLEEAEPIWWNRHNKGRILAGDIGAARIDTNKYGKKIAALDKQLKAALADKGRRSHGPCIQMSLIYTESTAAAPWDLIADNTDEEQRSYEALAESLAKWITSKEMEALTTKAAGSPMADRNQRYALERAQKKAKAALA